MTTQRFSQFHDEQPSLFTKPCHQLQIIFQTHPCIYGFVFITTVTFDLTELAHDWLLFRDLTSIEEGLVYGPLYPLHDIILLFICIVGTILFTFEILNLLHDFLTGKPWIDRDLVSALIVWLEQIAMVAINIVICLCHDEPISYFQLTKMLFACASVILRMIIPILRTCINKKKYSGNERCRNYIYKIVTTVGLCLLLCGSVSFFLFSHIVGNDESRFRVRGPQEIWQGQSLRDKYFTNVGIYFHHKKLSADGRSQYWIKLTDIIEVYNSKSVFVSLLLTENHEIIQRIALKRFDPIHRLGYQCFHLETPKKPQGLSHYYNTSCPSETTTGNFFEKITFKFVLVRPHLQLILGDITYNIDHQSGNKCRHPWSNDTGIFVTDNDDRETRVGEILYMMRGEDIANLDEDNKASDLPSRPRDLEKINQLLYGADVFWKTGLFGCDCTGKKKPSMNRSLGIIC